MDTSDVCRSKSGERGWIFNIQPFSIHDGPGIRTTVFMKGCPLTCEWCCNPDSWNTFPDILTRDIKCICCGRCVQACPIGAIAIDEGRRVIDRATCDLCLECAKVCPSGAIAVSGELMSTGEIVQEVAKDQLFYNNSGGGITISGGEPLLQSEFVAQVFEACKERGIHTVLDTSGYAPWNAIEPVLEYVDLVLYDLSSI